MIPMVFRLFRWLAREALGYEFDVQYLHVPDAELLMFNLYCLNMMDDDAFRLIDKLNPLQTCDCG